MCVHLVATSYITLNNNGVAFPTQSNLYLTCHHFKPFFNTYRSCHNQQLPESWSATRCRCAGFYPQCAMIMCLPWG